MKRKLPQPDTKDADALARWNICARTVLMDALAASSDSKLGPNFYKTELERIIREYNEAAACKDLRFLRLNYRDLSRTLTELTQDISDQDFDRFCKYMLDEI